MGSTDAKKAEGCDVPLPAFVLRLWARYALLSYTDVIALEPEAVTP